MRVLIDTLLEGHYRDQQQATDYFRLISRENERLTHLIDNFLSFSRMERRKYVFDFEPLRVDDVIRRAARAAGDRLRGPDCRLTIDVEEALPTVRADESALTTVLLNLLDNACKYTQGTKEIAVRAYSADGKVCIAVSDNGVGLSPRASRRIFDRFHRVHQTLSAGAGGSGLGLSIVKFIVDAHGGDIAVESRPGKGSTLIVTLPATPQAT
jgi:signal transduction histidine kinase